MQACSKCLFSLSIFEFSATSVVNSVDCTITRPDASTRRCIKVSKSRLTASRSRPAARSFTPAMTNTFLGLPANMGSRRNNIYQIVRREDLDWRSLPLEIVRTSPSTGCDCRRTHNVCRDRHFFVPCTEPGIPVDGWLLVRNAIPNGAD